MSPCNENNVINILKLLEAPYDEEIVNMDCNDYCEQLAELAERVAEGDDLTRLLPALQEHMQYWSDCCEEFEALVEVIKAEQQSEGAES